jgi:hypothetical protein
MPICPVCTHENTYGALSCAQCYSPLVELTNNQENTPLPTDRMFLPKEPISPKRQLSRHTAALPIDSIALYIDDYDEPLVVPVSQQAILGRYTPNSATQPRIDLGPFGGYDKGISRIHAIIRRTDAGLIIEDLGSSNGSWLNSQRLKPYIPSPLRSGDLLRLGQVKIEIHFSSSAMRQLADPFQGSPF